MAVIGNIIIGLKADLANLTKNLTQAKSQVSTFASQATTLTSGIGLAIPTSATAAAAAGIGLVTAGLIKAAKAASDLGEALDAGKAVFREDAGLVIAAAEEMAARFGIVKAEFLEATSALGSIFKASGLARREAAGMSVQFAKLATDLSSLRNVGVDEALAAIQSGLVGEAEPLRRFGVLLSEAAVQAEAVRLRLVTGTGALTEAAKVRARASIITRQLADANDNLALTMGSVANQVRAMRGRLENAFADVGAVMEPVTKQMLGLVTDVFAAFAPIAVELTRIFSAALTPLVGRLRVVFGVLAIGLKPIAAGLSVFAGGVELVSNVLVGMGRVAVAFLAPISGLLDMLGAGFQWIADRITTAFQGVAAFLNNVFAGVMEGFAAVIGLIASDDIVKAIKAQAAALRSAAIDFGTGGTPSGAAPKSTGPRFAGAMELGGAEARRVLLATAFGPAGGTAATRTATATERAAIILARIETKIVGGPTPPVVTVI